MSRHLLFFAAVVAGASYCIADHVALNVVFHAVWKGSGVGLLAVWAMLMARSTDGWLLAAVLAFGALGDVLLEVAGLTVGALAFLVSHLVAIMLYLRNRRVAASGSQRVLAGMLLLGTPLIGWLLTRQAGVAVYAAALGAMAASAWLSRFPRYRVGAGAVLFVVSDLLIFARGGALADSALAGLLIWPTYFAGQALIAWGVAGTLERVRQ